MIKMSLRPLKVKAEKEKAMTKGTPGHMGEGEDRGSINNYK